MVAGTSAEQLTQLGRSMGDVLIAPSAGPDDGPTLGRGARLIQFGRVAVDKDLALNLYVVSGDRRFAFMWSVLGRDMTGCLVLVESETDESMTNARQVLAAVADSGVSALVVGVSGDASRLQQVAERLDLSPGTPIVPCECGDRSSVKQALCAVLREVLSAHVEASAVPRPAAVSVPAGAV
jgi:signal recognition particle receptor subunit beta